MFNQNHDLKQQMVSMTVMVVVNMMIGFTVDWLSPDTTRFKNKACNALQELYAVSLLDCHNVTSTKA